MVILIHLLAALIGALASLVAVLPLWRAGQPRAALWVALGCALAGIGLYNVLGTPAALQPAALQVTTDPTEAGTSRVQLERDTHALRQSLEQSPGQAEGWLLLARAEALLGNTAAAAQAWQRVLTLEPDNPALLVEAAQARADADPQRRIDDTALSWLENARRIDPQAQRALWLLGIAQRQRGEPAAAAETWQQLLGLLDGDTANSVREQIAKARADAGLPSLSDAPATAPIALADTPHPTQAHDTVAPHTLHISVALDPALAARIRIDPATPVFVQARAVGGPPLPVAARRLTLGELPAQIRLSDADSVMPGQVLSAQSQVQVSARIAVSGSVSRSQDDVETAPQTVTLPHPGTIELQLRP